MNIFRFTYESPRNTRSGIVTALTEEGARYKVIQYLVGNNYTDSPTEDERYLFIRPWEEDKNYDKEFPDVIDCYDNDLYME